MSTDTANISAGNGASLVPQEVQAFVLRCEGLDAEDQQGITALREWFCTHPDTLRETWSMSRQALKALIETASAAGEIPMNRVCLDEMLRQLHADLDGKDASPLEQLLIEAVLFSWLAYWSAAYTSLAGAG
jgi:hypothetical protein